MIKEDKLKNVQENNVNTESEAVSKGRLDAAYTHAYYDELINRSVPFAFQVISCLFALIMCILYGADIVMNSDMISNIPWKDYFIVIFIALWFIMCYLCMIGVLSAIRCLFKFVREYIIKT